MHVHSRKKLWAGLGDLAAKMRLLHSVVSQPVAWARAHSIAPQEIAAARDRSKNIDWQPHALEVENFREGDRAWSTNSWAKPTIPACGEVVAAASWRSEDQVAHLPCPNRWIASMTVWRDAE